MVVDVHTVAAACAVQVVGGWAWYHRYPNPYRRYFLLGGFLIGVFTAALCMLLDGKARYLLLLSSCVSGSVTYSAILHSGRTGFRDGAFFRRAEEVVIARFYYFR